MLFILIFVRQILYQFYLKKPLLYVQTQYITSISAKTSKDCNICHNNEMKSIAIIWAKMFIFEKFFLKKNLLNNCLIQAII